MGKKKEGCGCWFRSFFAPVSAPPCEPKSWLFWRNCSLPALPPGVSETCPFKPLFTFGLLWVQFLRRLFVPSSGFVVYAKGKDDKAMPPECEKLVRAKDMPLYSEYKAPSQQKKKEDEVNDNSVLVTTIRCMREELCVFMEQVDVVKQQLSDIYLTGKAHTQSTIDYLREPDNTYPRIGAMTVGALTGYLLALRKGKFKKLLYMGAGSGAVTAALYPKETQEYAEDGLAYFKRYVIISYHFLNGDWFAGKKLRLAPVRKRKYQPNPLQQDYLDIQGSLASDERCTCKEKCKEEEEAAAEEAKKKGKKK